MLEDLALQYIVLTEWELRSIVYGLGIFGALIAGVVSRSKGELRRAPYFAYLGCLYLLSAATQPIWVGLTAAMTGGYVWIFMTVDVIASVVVGYFMGVIAMARSRDAYGHGRYALFAFIPIANIVLLLKGPKNEFSVNHIATVPLLTGGMGVLFGFVMFAIGHSFVGYPTEEMQRKTEREQYDPASQQTAMEFLIRSQGLEEALKQTIAEYEISLPLRVNEVLTLVGVELDATTVRYLYTVEANITPVTDAWRDGLIQNACRNGSSIVILQSGGTFEHAYYLVNKDEIDTVRITREQCGF